MKKYTKRILLYITAFSLITAIITIINKVIFVFSTIKNRLYNSYSYYYEWKFGKIHYIIRGEGKPILLVHSIKNGSSYYEYKKMINILSQDYKVYAIDLIGYGSSDKPNITYTAYIYVQLINDFIKYVIKQPTDIVTNGDTNSYVVMACYQNSSLFNKLIFINPGELSKLAKNPTKKDTILKYILESPIIGTSIYNLISSKRNIEIKFKNYYLSNNNFIKKKYIEAFYESAHIGNSNNKYVYASQKCKYNNVNIVPALRALNNSMYIIQGTKRVDNFEKILSTYKEINPAIEACTIDKTKEYPHIEKPESMQEILSVYLH